MTNNRTWKRGALLLGIMTLTAGELLAQGTSPWLEAVDTLQQAFTGPIARGSEFDRRRSRRLDVRFR